MAGNDAFFAAQFIGNQIGANIYWFFVKLV
jgi:hypothetical protein